ncbi:zinc finger protein ZFP1 [Trypanosoma cruzi]|nr:zinc finger protein ZFP1 [Trypanosoma cruzi]
MDFAIFPLFCHVYFLLSIAASSPLFCAQITTVKKSIDSFEQAQVFLSNQCTRIMQPQTPTFSDARSDNSVGFNTNPRYGRRGVDYSKFRTRVCRNYSMGITCPFGERCAFSHGEPDKSHVRTEEAELPPPPPYPEGVHAEIMLPPAYPSRFRHDPYSFNGVLFEN